MNKPAPKLNKVALLKEARRQVREHNFQVRLEADRVAAENQAANQAKTDAMRAEETKALNEAIAEIFPV